MTRLSMEAQECMVRGRWLDLASLMLTSADLMFSKASDKGTVFSINLFMTQIVLKECGIGCTYGPEQKDKEIN